MAVAPKWGYKTRLIGPLPKVYFFASTLRAAFSPGRGACPGPNAVEILTPPISRSATSRGAFPPPRGNLERGLQRRGDTRGAVASRQRLVARQPVAVAHRIRGCRHRRRL